MPIRPHRIAADIAAIAAITQTPGNGATRPTFSAEWGRARDYVIAEAQKIGCTVRIDAAGNVFAKPSTLPADAMTWLVGSHVDTVPHGGDYDGVAGVVTALELLRSAHDDGNIVPVELVIFAEEEGPTFGLGMLGSRALVGDLTVEQLGALKNKHGQSYLEAGRPYGVVAGQIVAQRLRPQRHRGLVELHIEQGPGMWRRDQRLAVVTAIAGRRQYRVVFQGEANHAGATSMQDRKDALAGAAEFVVCAENIALALERGSVMTVGRLDVSPNAVNVIANRVTLTVDLRAPADEVLDQADAALRGHLTAIATRRGLSGEIEQSEAVPARPMAAALLARFRGLAPEIPTAVSGALHDSAILAPHLPTVMLFVPSKDGISHNPAEFSRVEDIAEGARLIEKLVRQVALADLNAMDRDGFVAICGRFYEHSPWIAERAWASRPFTSADTLASAMRAVVAGASIDEKLALIRAHPDLVGRLARENKLTAESNQEQAAAGLVALTPDEVTTFERYNAAYRERFNFPFVICARQNKKDAILDAIPIRLQNTPAQEVATALAEINKIAELRLRDAVAE